MHDEMDLLTAALDLSPARAEALRQRLPGAGGLIGLWHAGSDAVRDVLPARAKKRLDAWLALTEQAMDTQPPPTRMVSAEDVAQYFRSRLALHSVESFWTVMLDARGGVIAMQKVSQGTLTACVVHPREVFAHAIRARAAHMIIVHNHPSGDPEPSPEDISITESLTEAGLLMGIPIIDHVIVARAGYRSIGLPHPAPPRRGRHGREAEAGGFSPSEPVCQYQRGRGPCVDPPRPPSRPSPRSSQASPPGSRAARAKAT